MTRGDVIATIGLLAAPIYFLVYIPSVGWGEPGTERYASYELANRGMSVVLALTVLLALAVTVRSAHRRTAMAVLVGTLLMLAGSFAEFWLFSQDSYKSASRGAAWGTFLLGALIYLVSASALGIRRAARIAGV